jgi:membrane-bound lytic murein transglycosylase C
VSIALASPDLIAEEDAFDALDRSLDENFEKIDRTLEEQFLLLDQAMEDAYQRFSREIEAEWGEDEVELPSKKEWVDYSDDMKTRRKIDFEAGVVKLERLVNPGDKADSIITDMQNAVTSLRTDTLADLADKDQAVVYARESLTEEAIDLSTQPIDAAQPV